MPIITFDYKDLIKLLRKEIDKKELIDKLPMMGVSIERIENNEISIEVFPNRPDMLCIEGIARALRAFLGIEKGLKKYEISPPKISLYVENDLEKIRPYIAGAIIRNIEIDDKTIKSLMESQEKLHFSLGKDRKKMAIGVHDFDKVKPPFYYKAVAPNEIKFVPLGKDEEMDLDEILKKHEKGIAYAHLLRNFEKYPIIIDKEGNVLSFPPIINGILTAINEETKNIFIEVTGIDIKAVLSSLVIISTALAERGGKLEQIEVIGKEEKSFVPNLTPRLNIVKIDYIKKLLKIEKIEDIIEAIKRMGHDAEIVGNEIKVYSPAWRVDILHPIDIIEDIAIGYGYENFPKIMPYSMTFGSSLSFEKLHQTMIGLGFNEVVTLSLSSYEKEFIKMEIKGNPVEIKNPISSEHTIIRQSLLPSLLEILNKNRHNELPQKIYEIGDIAFYNGKVTQKKMLAGVKIDVKANFTECKSIVEAILRNFGLKLDVKEGKHNSFIEGRFAIIVAENEEIGYFGELKPSVIRNFDLEYPVIGFEIDIMKLFSLSKQN